MKLILSLSAGIALGLLYFGGLWWTVQQVARARRAALIVMASFVVRTLLALAGFYLIVQWGLPALALAILGFFMVRLLLTRYLKPVDAAGPRRRAEGGGHGA